MYEETENTETSWRAWIRKPSVLFLIMATAIWLYYRGKAGMFIYDKATTYYYFTILFLMLGLTSVVTMKHFTPKLVVNPIYTTTIGKWFSAGNFACFTGGDIFVSGIHQRGRDMTIIVPIDSITKLGNSVASTVTVENTAYEELLPEVKDAVKEFNLPSPYYMGFIDKEQIFDELDDPDKISGFSKPKTGYMVNKLKSLSRQVNFYKKLWQRDYSTVEEAMEAMERLGIHKEATLSRKVKESLFDESP